MPEGEVVAPFVSNPGIRRASAIAERGAIAQSEGVRGEIQMSAADMKTAGELIQHVREDISEHRIAAPQGRPAPQERMQNANQRQIQAAIPFGQAYRAATGTSPIERHQRDVADGRAFDANHLLGGRR